MRFDAILFDCDGVLVDSEPITNGVLRDMLEEGGWPYMNAPYASLSIHDDTKVKIAPVHSDSECSS
ncbi:hypothetical protein BH10PSE16_BH10PSE16_43650 [soil metagenome]